MQRARSRTIIWVAGTSLLLALCASLVWNHSRRQIEDREYLIGWQYSPPFQERAADGSPAGLAVDWVREAARRRGIRLKWIWHPGSSEAALRNRELDLWPFITITPERLKVIHISEPYFQHDYSLLVRADSPHSRLQDMASASIGYHLPIGKRLLESTLPRARLVETEGENEQIEKVCAGRIDAAFLNEFTAGAILLSGIACPS